MRLRVEGVCKKFGRVQAAQKISFVCESGTITGLVGPNGSGKSTTLKIVAGLVRPDEGAVWIDGRSLPSLPNPGREVGFLLDSSAHHPGRSVRETVRLPSVMMGVSRRRVDDVLEMVGLSVVSRRKVRSLSMGMRQRLSLAVALLGEPGLLVLDEPANGLDVNGIAWLKSSLRSLSSAGASILVSSHLLGELETFADRVVMLNRGSVVLDSPLGEIRKSRSTRVSGPDAMAVEEALVDAGLDFRRGEDPDSGFEVHETPGIVGELMWKRNVQLSLLARDSAGVLEQVYDELAFPEFSAARQSVSE